ncbi:hypothetical protein H102_03042 [Trichophyton rubrum CBS 100081]|nr:hypothetical protein H102_03042 [Trichophyton rubrum CBS 100081]
MLAVAEVRPDKNTLSLPQYNRVVTKARYVSQLRWTPFMVLDPVYVIPGLIKAEVESTLKNGLEKCPCGSCDTGIGVHIIRRIPAFKQNNWTTTATTGAWFRFGTDDLQHGVKQFEECARCNVTDGGYGLMIYFQPGYRFASRLSSTHGSAILGDPALLLDRIIE